MQKNKGLILPQYCNIIIALVHMYSSSYKCNVTGLIIYFIGGEIWLVGRIG